MTLRREGVVFQMGGLYPSPRGGAVCRSFTAAVLPVGMVAI